MIVKYEFIPCWNETELVIIFRSVDIYMNIRIKDRFRNTSFQKEGD